MSGIDEKPVKQEMPSLRTEKFFDSAYEEFMEMMRLSRLERIAEACTTLKIDLFFLVVSLTVTAWSLTANEWSLIISILVSSIFLGVSLYSVKKYLDAKRLDEGHTG